MFYCVLWIVSSHLRLPAIDLSGLVPDLRQSRLSICLSPRRTVNPRWLRNFARESFSKWSKKTRERMQNRAQRGIRRTNYRKITRQSILSSVARTKKVGRGTGRKFTSKDLAGASPPSLPPFLMRSQARYPEWRDTQKAARHRNYSGQSSLHAEAGAIFYSISSAGCDGCRDGRSLWKRERRELLRLCENFRARLLRTTWEAQDVYDMRNKIVINRKESDRNNNIRENQFWS